MLKQKKQTMKKLLIAALLYTTITNAQLTKQNSSDYATAINLTLEAVEEPELFTYVEPMVDDLLKIDPTHYGLVYAKGFILANYTRNYQEALKYFQFICNAPLKEAVSQEPDLLNWKDRRCTVDAYWWLGMCLLKLERFDEAAQAFQEFDLISIK